ncbi:MAG: transcription termination/antitermination protein NusA [Deltaproteobacteria bacterium GWC2_42_11]|nr:MAG: transcription termination/antitermination protein NusA [Deltaproteobacteria bacterium GWC2_42_11]HBO85147.1 transcription termination/antitermination protein NusA [Deltaproteobacteria bacterium]
MGLSLNNVLEQVGKDKGLDKSVLVDAIESALLTAARKKYGSHKEIESHYNEELGEIELFQFKTVRDKVSDPDTEISLEDAVKLDPDVAAGDSLGIKLDISDLGRIAAQTAKQIITQKVRDAERDAVYNEYIGRRGDVVTGIVQRFERGDIIVDLGRAEALFPKKEQVRGEGYRQGDRIRGLIIEVRKASKGPSVVISRTHPDFVGKLFKDEVPEIYEGIIEIKGIAREPGDRTKVAVYSKDSDVDPVGACVGVKGSRVQAVVQELRGEKIDIVPWSNDHVKFICSALSPAQVSRVFLDEKGHFMEVVVADDQLSLAIGKRGQNVRLAARLTGWKLDIKSETEAIKIHKEEMEDVFAKEGAEELPEGAEKGIEGTGDDLLNAGVDVIEGVGEKTGKLLNDAGFKTVGDIAKATVDELSAIEGIGVKKAEKIIGAANKYLEEKKGK